jgi:hypothetical protein
LGKEDSSNRTFLLDNVKAAFSIMTMTDHKKNAPEHENENGR